MNLAEPAIGGNARAEFLNMQMASACRLGSFQLVPKAAFSSSTDTPGCIGANLALSIGMRVLSR
ncbi:hypothetical protein [Rhizobium laguerreae]|uniref:hypothetical protein n=1 Tax=Rhizobium laguerreae TaxID=1076926 RepID=UPI001FED78AB|nr:hypothetical protein [Rhizobium laguerreae]